MRDGTPFHLGFLIATSFYHQATDTRTHTTFVDPYVTWLIQGMDLFECMGHISSTGKFSPINLHSLQRMGHVTLPQSTTLVNQSRSDTLFLDEHPSIRWLGQGLQCIGYHCKTGSTTFGGDTQPEKAPSWSYITTTAVSCLSLSPLLYFPLFHHL